MTTVMTAPPTAAWNAQTCRFHIDDYRGDLHFRKPVRSVLMPAGRVLVGDVPLHVAGVDSLHDTLAVVPSQTASRANGLACLEVRKAVAGSLVKSAPVARGLDATVVLPLVEKLGLGGLEPGLDLLELGLWRQQCRARFLSFFRLTRKLGFRGRFRSRASEGDCENRACKCQVECRFHPMRSFGSFVATLSRVHGFERKRDLVQLALAQEADRQCFSWPRKQQNLCDLRFRRDVLAVDGRHDVPAQDVDGLVQKNHTASGSDPGAFGKAPGLQSFHQESLSLGKA